MSYPLDIDEISTDNLCKELKRRFTMQMSFRCPYCERPVETCLDQKCKMRVAGIAHYHQGTGVTLSYDKKEVASAEETKR